MNHIYICKQKEKGFVVMILDPNCMQPLIKILFCLLILQVTNCSYTVSLFYRKKVFFYLHMKSLFNKIIVLFLFIIETNCSIIFGNKRKGFKVNMFTILNL